MSLVQQFYAEQNIFITGATGFIGKLLVEKLLRSCPDVGTIYILIRPKKGKNTEERINALFANQVFDVLRAECPDFSKKVVGVIGDVTHHKLGLSTEDHSRLVNEVSVIFHVAATVRFTEELRTAVAINVNGTKSVIDIAKACKNLKAAIYVSTAYSQCVRKSTNEEIYPPPYGYESINKLIADVEKEELSEDQWPIFTKSLLGEWPNTYTFTKAIAEGVVAEFASDLPFAVVRPSIVISTYREPIPGWMNDTVGLSTIVLTTDLGILHVMLVDRDVRADIVPVDSVCNALICSAWETAVTERRRHEKIPVYNYTSGNQNPVTWKQFEERVLIFGSMYPPNAAVYYPCVTLVTSRWQYYVLELFFHLIPAMIIDSLAIFSRKQPGLYKIANRLRCAILVLDFFATQQWDYENQRIQNLWKRMGPMDKRTFSFDIRDVDWDEHAMKMMKGVRKYMLGEPEGNQDQARRRHTRLYIVHTVLRLILGCLLLWIIWKICCGRVLTIGI